MGEHKCAHSCPVHPHGIEEREIMTLVSTNVLACVLGVHMASKRGK